MTDDRHPRGENMNPAIATYRADKHRVRRVNADGQIATIAYCENSTIALMIAVCLNATVGKEHIFPKTQDEK